MSESKPTSAADYDTLLRVLPCGVLRLSPSGEILAASDATLALLGYALPELLGQPLAMILPADSQVFLEEIGGPRNVLRTEKTLRTKHGMSVPVSLSAARLRDPAGGEGTLVCGILDLREKHRMQIELEQAQQLGAVGRITAGIAHEINTPVQFIGDSVHFLQESFESLATLTETYQALREAAASGHIEPSLVEKAKNTEDDIDLEFLQEEVPGAVRRTLDGVGRVAEIARAVKEFCYPDQGEKVAVDLNSALKNVLIVARNEYKHVAELETDFDEIPPVFCHIGHLNQVFLNLLINASHAIADKVGGGSGKGTIRIGTAHEGEKVVISIGDTGCGIPLEIRERIFDAFFTTKDRGLGSGQGLTIARSIVVDKHDGDFEFESEPGVGTTFFIRLPIDTPEALESA